MARYQTELVLKLVKSAEQVLLVLNAKKMASEKAEKEKRPGKLGDKNRDLLVWGIVSLQCCPVYCSYQLIPQFYYGAFRN
jgi:hypothetical protein